MTARVEIRSDWGLVGHEWAIRALARSVATDRVAHAYLFTGPHGIGKTTLARKLAQAWQCAGDNRPCGACPPCQKIARDRHPDVQIIEGVPPRYDFDKDPPPPPRANDWERRALRIRQIRDLERGLARAPFEGRWKIVILRRFEESEEEAANAFLKTLEEPPRHTRLILTARDASLLLPTIASRCQVFALRPLAPAQIERALIEKYNAAPEHARLLARLSAGRLGWAVRAHENRARLDARNRYLDELNVALSEGRAERLLRAESLAKKSDDLPELLETWLGWWRDVLLIQNGDGSRTTNVDREDALRDQAHRFTTEQAQTTLQAVRATARYLTQNVNARLALEVLLLNLPGK
ncbi:MAG: DNA polymerase III subunit delta' [Chloroflexi bacterium]|nr:DNA polymerase III subunit delta' [Chloroflexota bacterium]